MSNAENKKEGDFNKIFLLYKEKNVFLHIQ